MRNTSTFTVVFIIVWNYVVCDNYPQVEISDGLLNGGFLTTKNGRLFSGFNKIPFAKPPIGQLRFQPPVPNEPWKGALNATGVHAECPQRDVYRRNPKISGEEDCLYLNVYTPKLSNFEDELLPVMIWFHGGGLLAGSGNAEWYGPDILLDRDIVLVATNYRLGPLGFLATGDTVVPGNNGLKDQTLALKWIKKNIKNFGGDPNRVTLFGESAGGVSSNYHMISPLSRGLFSRAILQSGTTLCPWGLSENKETENNSKKLAEALNCPTDSSENTIECLRKVDAEKFVELDEIFKVWDYDPMIPFKPVVEPKGTKDPFLPDHPLNIIKSGKSMDVPIIIGVTSEDGGLKAAGYKNGNMLNEFAERFNELLPISLFYDRTEKNPDAITEKIKEFYFSGKKIQDSLKAIVDVYTDGWFFKCSDDVARLHVKFYKQPVYFYLFGYNGSVSFSRLFGGGNDHFGTIHADDLQYLFPVVDELFPDVIPSESDKKMATVLTTLWTNFAKTGNPTPEINDLIPNKWEPYTLENEEYFNIDGDGLETRKGIFKHRAVFWRNLINDPIQDFKDEL
ncbi:juvenile hormone esterase-like [Diorhabda carinulata]|uniref:juvenile hormone esterase-like n=1 Tax=Diorhabda carinulata TaxID=1163345 RepID=UPI0025A1AACB|nr:juvenile hormone esterase-like [Diorhabda carinulata]